MLRELCVFVFMLGAGLCCIGREACLDWKWSAATFCGTRADHDVCANPANFAIIAPE